MAELAKAAALCLVPVVFLGDQRIKNRIERSLKNGETKVRCGGRILIRKHHNYGGFLNIGQKHRKLVTGIAMAATAAIAVLV